MRDRVVMPHVETLWEKAALQANALKLEQLQKTPRDKGGQKGPNRPIMELCGIILQVAASVWGKSNCLMTKAIV